MHSMGLKDAPKEPIQGKSEVRKMESKKGDFEKIALEVLDFLRPKELPIWQVKEILVVAARLSEWQKLK